MSGALAPPPRLVRVGAAAAAGTGTPAAAGSDAVVLRTVWGLRFLPGSPSRPPAGRPSASPGAVRESWRGLSPQ